MLENDDDEGVRKKIHYLVKSGEKKGQTHLTEFNDLNEAINVIRLSSYEPYPQLL
jgi:hypothetical protein